MERKNVIVLGKGDLAIKAAEWFLVSEDYTLTNVVPVVPEPQWAESFINWAVKNNVNYVQSGHYKHLPDVESDGWCIDLAFSVFYDKIIKDWFIQKCTRIANLHNSPLPKYRGVSPINWALKNEEDHHGVTIHEICPGIDDGPIISQVSFSIYPELDEVIDVYSRCLRFGWQLFQETMPVFDEIRPVLQDSSKMSYYSLEDNAKLGERRFFTRRESIENLKNDNK